MLEFDLLFSMLVGRLLSTQRDLDLTTSARFASGNALIVRPRVSRTSLSVDETEIDAKLRRTPRLSEEVVR